MGEEMNKKKQIQTVKQEKACLSCGTTGNMNGRRYCSIACRQRLRHMLEIRTGLLRALNTRYATFYFTDRMIVMDLLPYDSKTIFSFVYPRSTGKKPAEDFSRMSDDLGNAWWAEKRRTNRRYLASRHVFKKARQNEIVTNCLNPMETKIPAIKPRVEPPQMGERRITVRKPAKLPYMLMGYKVPTLKTATVEEQYCLFTQLIGNSFSPYCFA